MAVHRTFRVAARLIVILVVAVGWPDALAAAAQPVLSFRSPFHPEQCDRAIAFAERRLQVDSNDARSRLIQAEGKLCRGLQDDWWALEEAAALLADIERDYDQGFFARLAVAEVERKRFSSSDESLDHLRRLSAILVDAPVGAARVELARHIAENLAAVTGQRQVVLARIDADGAAAAAGTLAAEETYTFVTLAALTGIEGRQVAARALTAHIARHGDSGLLLLARAELGKGRARIGEVRQLYKRAEKRLSSTKASDLERSQCEVASARLARVAELQLQADHGTEARSLVLRDWRMQ